MTASKKHKYNTTLRKIDEVTVTINGKETKIQNCWIEEKTHIVDVSVCGSGVDKFVPGKTTLELSDDVGDGDDGDHNSNYRMAITSNCNSCAHRMNQVCARAGLNIAIRMNMICDHFAARVDYNNMETFKNSVTPYEKSLFVALEK